MEGGYSVSLLELDNILADLVDDPGNIIALVNVVGVRKPFCGLPVSLWLSMMW